MTSFDIHSLFINIPLDEAIFICVEIVFANKRKIKGFLKMGLSKIFKIIGMYIYIYINALLIYTLSCFIFNNVYYNKLMT